MLRVRGRRRLMIAGAILILAAGLGGQEQTRKEKRDEAKLRSVMGLVLDAQEQPASGAVV